MKKNTLHLRHSLRNKFLIFHIFFSSMIFLTAYQARYIEAFRTAKEIKVSLDLGMTKSKLLIENNELHFTDGQKLSLELLPKLIKNETSCFIVENNELKKLNFFS